jgi:hypothetical protein
MNKVENKFRFEKKFNTKGLDQRQIALKYQAFLREQEELEFLRLSLISAGPVANSGGGDSMNGYVVDDYVENYLV